MNARAGLRQQLMCVPNLLTLLRLLTIPLLVHSLLRSEYETALLLFCFAGATDAADGIAARMLNQRTSLGQSLDPIADKLMLSTLFITLTYLGLVPFYVTVLVFARDLGILAISVLLFFTGTLRDFEPSLLGKLNTVLQIVAVFLVVLITVWTAPWLIGTTHSLLVCVGWLAPVCAAQYAAIVIRRVSTELPPGYGLSSSTAGNTARHPEL